MIEVINAYTGEIYFTSDTETEARQSMRNLLLKDANDPALSEEFGENCIFVYDARGTHFDSCVTI